MKQAVTLIILMLAVLSVLTESNTITVANGAKAPDPSSYPAEETTRYVGVSSVTAYSELDSCHYRVKAGCLVASGKVAALGMVACPRSMKLGTKVWIANEMFTCEDRTAQRFDGRFDIFMGYGKEAHEYAKQFGIKRLMILQ